MNTNEKHVRDFVRDIETVKLGKWMVGMQIFASKMPTPSKSFYSLCVSCAASELLNRYRDKNDC